MVSGCLKHPVVPAADYPDGWRGAVLRWMDRVERSPRNHVYIIVLGDPPAMIRRGGFTWSRRRAERWLRSEQRRMGPAWKPRIEIAHLI